MKSRNRHNPAFAAISAWWLANIVFPAKAFHCASAAQRDECEGFPYTAAMEWRRAAELFGPHTRAAEYSWRKWERIMHLPRRLAEPVGVSQPATVPLAAASASRSAIAPVIDKISFADAA